MDKKMKVLVTGAGRGGTNLLTSLMMKISNLNFTVEVEDRKFFNYDKLPENYATKLSVENFGFDEENIFSSMSKNSDLYTLFVLRHPFDNCLSKIYRGRPASKGGDKTTEIVSADATKETSVIAVKKLYKILEFVTSNFEDRCMVVKMEDIILNPDIVVDKISKKLNFNPKNYEGFQENNKNRYQKKRYGTKIDQGQINLYENLSSSYDGFFEGKDVIPFFESELKNEVLKYNKW